MQYKREDIVVVISKMKKYYKNMYRLTPVDLADFLKIRSNFMQLGIILSDDRLSMSDEDVIKYVTEKLKNTKCEDGACYSEQNTTQFDLKETLALDIDVLNSDRTEIRKHLFNENTVVSIERVGRVFAVVWNSKMTVCKISVPSIWQINLPQSLLLDIEEKDNKFFDSINNQLTKLGGFIYSLLTRHSDYSIIKRMLDIELENNTNSILKFVDKRKLNKLKNRGLSTTTAALLLAFLEQVETKNFSSYAILSILGYRKRLVNEFNELISNVQ